MTNNFRIDSVGSYKNASGYKIEILGEDLHGWRCSKGKHYSTNGGSHSGRKQYDIIAKWEEPQINSDNSKVNVNMLKRITTLEAALREIVAYDKQGGINSLIMRDIAKKALGETE